MSKISVSIPSLVVWALLLVMGQLLVSQWTIEAAGNREVIDYISFAGTVVGIILAVLAIVYSYIASASQKEDSNYLRSQISSLNDIVSRASLSGNQFSEELGRLEEIRAGISKAVSNSEASLESFGRIEGLLMAKAEQDKPTQPSPTQPLEQNGANAKAALLYIAAQALPRQVVFYYIAMKQKGLSKQAVRDMKEQLVYAAIEDNKGGLRSFYDGEMKGYYWIFYDLDIIHEPKRARPFMRALLERISRFDEDSYSGSNFTLEGLKGSVEMVRSRMAEELADTGPRDR